MTKNLIFLPFWLLYVGDLVWAVMSLLRSNASKLDKALWVIGILLIPLGPFYWFLFGPKPKASNLDKQLLIVCFLLLPLGLFFWYFLGVRT